MNKIKINTYKRFFSNTIITNSKITTSKITNNPITNNPKYCINCINYIPYKYSNDKINNDIRLGSCALFGNKNIVTGKTNYDNAFMCRMDENKCGGIGKLYSKKYTYHKFFMNDDLFETNNYYIYFYIIIIILTMFITYEPKYAYTKRSSLSSSSLMNDDIKK